MSSNSDADSRSDGFYVSEVSTQDVGRSIARLSRQDMKRIGVQSEDIAEITSISNRVAYAKCLPQDPKEERKLVGFIQLDGVIRPNLRLDFPRVQEKVWLRRIDSVPSINYLSLEPSGDAELPRGRFDSRLLSKYLSDKPLWEGAFLVLPFEEVGYRYKVVAMEPRAREEKVTLATMKTRIEIWTRAQNQEGEGLSSGFKQILGTNKNEIDNAELFLVTMSRYLRDVGKNICRIDSTAMQTLGVSEGDEVEITLNKTIKLTCLPVYANDEGRGIIRLDVPLCYEAGAFFGDSVKVRKALQ